MAIQRIFGNSLMWPFLNLQADYTDFNGSILVIDASGEIAAYLGPVCWADRGTHDIHLISYMTGTIVAGSGSTRRTSIQDVDTANAWRPDGGINQSFTSTSMPSSNTWTTDTLTADETSVAHGALRAVVFDYTVFGSSTVLRYAGMVRTPTASAGSALFTASWAAQSVLPNVIFTASDGTFGWIEGTVPVSSTTINEGFNSGSTNDERGNQFTLAAPIEVDEIWAYLTPSAADRDFDLVLYDGTSALATASVDSHTLSAASAFRLVRRPIAPQSLTTSGTYRVMLKPGASTVTMSVLTINAAGHRAALGGTNFAYTGRVDGGTFDAPTTTKIALCGVGISGVSDAAGGGSAVGYRVKQRAA